MTRREVARQARSKGHAIGDATVTAYFRGDHGIPDDETLAALASVLPVSLVKLRAAAHLEDRDEPWEPPESSRYLSRNQRRALTALINSMTERQEQHRGNTAANDRAGVSPAPVPDDGKRPLTDDELAARRKRDRENAARAAEKAARHGKPDPGDEQD